MQLLRSANARRGEGAAWLRGGVDAAAAGLRPLVLCLAEPERWGRSVATRLIAPQGPAGAFWAYHPPAIAAQDTPHAPI